MNWLKYKKIYFLTSLTLILIGIFGLIKWGLTLSIDFKGGALAEYQFNEPVKTDELFTKIEDAGIAISSIQESGENKYLLKLEPLSLENKEKLQALLSEAVESGFTELRFGTVGPTIGPELVKKTIYAIAIAAGSILLWVAYQFKSFKFGVSAILAMLHDSFILIGSFSLLGHLAGAEVDFLFVTALLTTLSFSVHDTIVVFDRIREIGGKDMEDIISVSNQALTETMVRSLNNSFTIIFMLVALILLGGATVRWFSVALLIGTILGTYSSPFVAVPLLVSWDEVVNKVKNLVRRN